VNRRWGEAAGSRFSASPARVREGCLRNSAQAILLSAAPGKSLRSDGTAGVAGKPGSDNAVLPGKNPGIETDSDSGTRMKFLAEA